MAAPLVERSTGDIISSSDHNDVKTYIEDGAYRVNTLALEIGATEVISNTRVVSNVTGNISLWTNDSNYITGNQTITLSGDVTGSGTTSITTTIGTGAVTNAKLVNMSADTIKGRLSSTGTPQDLSVAQVNTLLGVDDKAESANAMGVVVHGATAGTARPTGYNVITWIGSVEPTNATDDDTWIDTD